jgi:signal transduction histidine kinase
MRSSVQQRAVVARLLVWVASMRGPFLVAVAYYLGAEAAFLVGTLSDRIFAPFWPPNVIVLCALVLVPYQRWWLYIAFAFPAHIIAELGVGMAWPQLLVAFATNCTVAVLNALGMRYFLGEPPWFDNFYKAILYGMITAVASPAIVALGGAFVRIEGAVSLDHYWTFWAQWYAANALASLTLGPVLLTWFGERPNWSEFRWDRRMGEGILLAVGLVLASIVAFKVGSWASRGLLPAVLYLPLPLVLWAAVRFQARGASAAILTVTIVSIWLTLNGATIFVDGDAENSVLGLQLFLTGLSVPILLLGASMDGLQRAEQTTAELARFVLGAQDEERRQVAKELHDRVAQDLVAAGWMSESLRSTAPEAEGTAAKRLEDVLRQSVHDLRTVSYLLHPPLLDDSGLQAALGNLVGEWSRRTGIEMTLDVSETLGRLSPDIELTVFRLVEDALANVTEHSGSAAAHVSVELAASPSRVMMTVQGAGKGMSDVGGLLALIRETVPIATVRGLRRARMGERLHRIGGKLEIKSGVGKTIIKADIPLKNQQVAAPAPASAPSWRNRQR